jgi:energy-coupling factor transporter ATP-binding protein EcfA2
VPNRHRQLVSLGDILGSAESRAATHPLEVALGQDIAGRAVMMNLAEMPHLLIAGSTGSGKSVSNLAIMGLLNRARTKISGEILFQGRDLLLMPTLAYPAPPLGRWREVGWIRTAISVSRWVLTAQWNLAGVAACSVPAGLSREGLPLAVQLVAPAGRERLLLEVAARIERRRAFPALSLRG